MQAMDFCKDMRSVYFNDAGFVANILNAAGAISQLRLQALMDNMKPLQQAAFNNRHYGPIIVGGLATGAMLYMGHRWMTNNGADKKDQKKMSDDDKKKVNANTTDEQMNVDLMNLNDVEE